MQSRKRKWILATIALALLGLSTWLYLPALLRAKFLERARSIQVGASKQEVLRGLGNPNVDYAKGTQIADVIAQSSLLLRLFIPVSPETWAYGKTFTFRFLGPEIDDILIEFDDDGHVSRVVIPDEPG